MIKCYPPYLHPMDFYKLTDFQLYSIINSRHLDKKSKEQAEREFARRDLAEDDVEKLKEELAEKAKAAPSSFTISPNMLLLLGAIILLFLLRQCVVAH